MEEFEETVGRLLNRAVRLLQRRGEPALAKVGLATAQVPVLATLRKDGRRTQKELAALIGTEQPTMAQLLARMERDGLVERTAHEADRRSQYVSLTPAARAKLPAARRVLMEGNAQLTAGLSEREVATLMQLLRRVIANLEET